MNYSSKRIVIKNLVVKYLNNFNKYDSKKCPRCGKEFICKPGNITQCQCYSVNLSKNESLFIKELYDDCLCYDCLEKLKILFNERRTIEYFKGLNKKVNHN